MAPYGTRALNVEELLAIVPDDSIVRSNPNIDQESDSLAYLIYTSGSTGRPKGVMLRHIGICNYLTDHEENRHFHALVHDCKTMLCITTVSFDLSLKEIGASLFNGMTLVFANEDQMNDPQALADLMKATGVDGFSGTPSRLKMFLDLPDFQQAFANCRFIVLGGEKYPPTLLPLVKTLAPEARLFNTYGPTEIMRYGNLAARSTDGEFQINFSSNSFMNRLNVYKTLGAIPYSKSASLTEFSPINEVAHATVLLAMTPKQFTVFMPINSHHEPLSDVIVCMRRLGYRIDDVEPEVFDNIVEGLGFFDDDYQR